MQRIHTVLVYEFTTGRGNQLIPKLCKSFVDFDSAETYQQENSRTDMKERLVAEIVSNQLS